MQGVLCEMDKTGDDRIYWDSEDDKSIKKAKKRFDELKAKGYSFFSVGSATGGRDKKVKSFDPTLGQIIAVPQLSGG